MRMRNRTNPIRLGAAVIALAVTVALPAPAGAGQGVTVEGRLEVFHADLFEQGRATHEYFLRTAEERLALRFPDEGPHHLAAFRVRVTGNREGNVVIVPSSRSPHVERIDGGSSGADTAGVAAAASGARDTLVILIDFLDTTPTPTDPAVMSDEVFTAPTSVASYYNEISFGQTTLQGAVTNWLPINDSSSPCDYDSWGQAARTAASSAGWILGNYEHIVHYFPKTSACGWSGLGQLGGPYTWINGTWQVSDPEWNELVIGHEIGHNLTLHHSGSLTCQANSVRVALSSNCTNQEYGDLFDVMGDGYDHFNSFHKAHLGWFPAANIATVTSGQHTLSAMENSCTGCLQVLRIPRGSEYLYVEYRQPFGFDGYASTDPVANGASLRLAPDYPLNNQRTRLIDAQPSTTTFLDAALPQGSGFADGTGIHVETTAVAPGSLTVLVKTGYTDPSPSFTLGSGHTIQVRVPHTHGPVAVADAGKNLMSYAWSLSRCSGSCPTLSNKTGTLQGGSATVPGTTFTPSKRSRYRLKLTVWDTSGKIRTATVEERAV
jgi:hypothetical protein